VYLDAVHAARSQGLHFEHGRHSPLYCTSIGKLFLADMPREAFERWLTQVELKAAAPNTIVSADKLRRVIDGVRKQQWASSNEEMAAGVVGCAVPVRDANGRLIAGLGVSAPSARLPFSQIDQFREPMRAAAAEISSRLSAD
jgi:DNA-binding IclR family transcriptional regulator